MERRKGYSKEYPFFYVHEMTTSLYRTQMEIVWRVGVIVLQMVPNKVLFVPSILTRLTKKSFCEMLCIKEFVVYLSKPIR